MKDESQINDDASISTEDAHRNLVHRLKKDPHTIFITSHISKDVIHMLMGIQGEVGELTDCIKKSLIYGQDLDYDNLIEELGDIEFYLQGLRAAFNLSRETILRKNIEKLSKRYSSGSYSDKEAKERNDKVNPLHFAEGDEVLVTYQKEGLFRLPGKICVAYENGADVLIQKPGFHSAVSFYSYDCITRL